MNEARADSFVPRPSDWPSQLVRRSTGWSWQKWLSRVALVFAAQVAFILLLGRKEFPPPRTVTNVPQFTLTESSDELMALDDPTLFALPHANDFASAVWLKKFVTPAPNYRWAEPPGELLSPAGESLGAVFAGFMRTNQLSPIPLNFKLPAKLSEPVLTSQPIFAENSTLYVRGELAQRKLLNPVSLPSWPYADVIAPSRVQVLVDAAGNVISAVLLSPDSPVEAANHYDAADRRALALARNLRFAPAPRLTIGLLIFDWRTVAPPATNLPAALP